jgi:hypothetical protein
MAPGPLDRLTAFRAVARCFASSLGMLRRREVRLARANVGRTLRFTDGTSAQVYRETIADRVPADPCFLAVRFRLRGIHGWMHRVFEAESLLNTPLFIGFPGFCSKLWLTHDERDSYRGLYEWDGAPRAERYARSLWRVLALVSAPGSINYQIVPGLRRDDVLADPSRLNLLAGTRDAGGWWRPRA